MRMPVWRIAREQVRAACGFQSRYQEYSDVRTSRNAVAVGSSSTAEVTGRV
jgi:hypothetical protein